MRWRRQIVLEFHQLQEQRHHSGLFDEPDRLLVDAQDTSPTLGAIPIWTARNWRRASPSAARDVDVVFRFARDSPLEGSGFKPSVPRDTTKVSEPAQVASAGFRSNRSTARTRADTAGTPGAFRRTDGSNSCSLQQRVRCELEVS